MDQGYTNVETFRHLSQKAGGANFAQISRNVLIGGNLQYSQASSSHIGLGC